MSFSVTKASRFVVLVASAVASLSAVALVKSFWRRREESTIVQAPKPPTVNDTDKQTVLVVGGGAIGSSFCALFLACGMNVVCCDPRVLKHELEQSIHQIWPHLVARGLTSESLPTLEKLKHYGSLNSAVVENNVTFVQECVWEQLHVKQEILKDLDELIEPSVVIASSTSFITLPLLTCFCKQKYRIMIGHPAIPHTMAYMELFGVQKEWVQYAKEWYLNFAKMDVLVMRKTIPGHVLNSFLKLNIDHINHLIEKGVCCPEEANKVVRYLGRQYYGVGGLLSLLSSVGGSGGAEQGLVLSKHVKDSAIHLVLFSGLQEQGIPYLLADPAAKILSSILKFVIPDLAPDYIEACREFERQITDGGKVPVQTAMFHKSEKMYDRMPMEVGNDPLK